MPNNPFKKVFSSSRQGSGGPLPAKLVVGLGNPGEDYAESLHNVGFMCVNYFARQNGIRFDKAQAEARTGQGKISGVQVLVARPHTYMNRSGEAVNRLMKKFRLTPADLLVVYDDLDLPLGRLRIRAEGGPGGHNGMKSIIQETGSQDFPRLRIGIGRPIDTAGLREDKNADVITYLLSEFPPEVKKAINQVLPMVNEAISSVITDGVTTAMNRFNKNTD